MERPTGLARPHSSLFAVAALALAAFGLAAWQAVGQWGLQRLDEPAAAWALGLGPWALLVAKGLAGLGGNELILPLTIIAGAVLFLRGRRAEGAVLALLPFATQLVVHALKAAFALSRPHEQLITTLGYGFPSGHTANAAVCGALGAWFAVRHGLLQRSAAIALAVVWTALMGFSRMASGAHYLTDIVGGATIALGFSALGLAGVVLATQTRSVEVTVPVPVAGPEQAPVEPVEASPRRDSP